MPTKATNIDDVLDNLGTIIADTKRRSDPLGCFAALYRQVTLGIKRGIKDGLFDDGPRMSRFDAQFANAYFAAYEQFGKGRKAGRAWHFAFERTLSADTIVLQDLLLAINAHINLDLGVVTGTEFARTKLPSFQRDFDRINEILASVIPMARDAIEEFSPRLAELTTVGGSDVALALDFSVEAARDEAWRTATVVAHTPRTIRPLLVETIDARTKLLGRVVAAPPEPIGSVVRHIRRAESTDVPAIITALDALV